MATEKQKARYYLGATAAAAVLGLVLIFRKKTQAAFVTAGGTFEGWASQMFQVRLPAGQEYTMLGGDGLTLMSQVRKGDMQDLQVLINDSALPFTVTPTFIDKGDDSKSFTITVKVLPLED